MFDIGWTEIMVIVAVAVIVVGPKDIPKMLRSVGKYVRKGRTMMRDVRRQVEEIADISEIKDLKAEAENLKKFTEEGVSEAVAKPTVKTTSKKTVPEEATSKKPSTKKSAAKKPAAKKSATKKPAAKKSAAKKPATKKSVAKKPAAKKSATKKAVPKKTTAKKTP